jgi:hypothetical protein
MILRASFLITLMSLSILHADDIVVRSPAGDHFIVKIAPHETFQEVSAKIDTYLALSPAERAATLVQAGTGGENNTQKGDVRIDYKPTDVSAKPAKKDLGLLRDYTVPATSQEKDTIYYIVTTLGNKSIATIVKETSNLKKTRAKLNNLHPLRFAEVIFTNENLKAAVANIKGRAWWSQFRSGLTDSLAEESKKQNLNLDQIHDFAKNVGIDPNLIIGPLQKGKWDEFLTILIDKVPRQGDPGRYAM